MPEMVPQWAPFFVLESAQVHNTLQMYTRWTHMNGAPILIQQTHLVQLTTRWFGLQLMNEEPKPIGELFNILNGIKLGTS